MNFPDEPMFYTVFCVEPAADAYIITGIFSRLEDAEHHCKERNAIPRHAGSATIQRLAWEQVTTLLVRDRIRELAEVLDGPHPRVKPLNVYSIKVSSEYGGGMVIVAAETQDAAIDLVQTPETSELSRWLRYKQIRQLERLPCVCEYPPRVLAHYETGE